MTGPTDPRTPPTVALKLEKPCALTEQDLETMEGEIDRLSAMGEPISENDARAAIAEVRRLRRELMLARLELRHYQEFIEFNPELQSRWKQYEERLRTPQVDHLTYPRDRGKA